MTGIIRPSAGSYRGCKKTKSGEAALCFFRFLFRLQKGSRVWDSVPVLLSKSKKSKLINLLRKDHTEPREAGGSVKEKIG